MVDDQEDPDEGDYIPTEEELARARQAAELARRYPTFQLLAKTLRRHRRLGRLQDLEAPDQIIDQEKKLREDALEELAAAFPFDLDINVYHLPDIIETLVEEIRRPHEQGGDDA